MEIPCVFIILRIFRPAWPHMHVQKPVYAQPDNWGIVWLYIWTILYIKTYIEIGLIIVINGLKSNKCRFTSKDGEAVCLRNWVCFPPQLRLVAPRDTLNAFYAAAILKVSCSQPFYGKYTGFTDTNILSGVFIGGGGRGKVFIVPLPEFEERKNREEWG